MPVVESARLDRWLWSVRVYHTRSAATEACRGGHVRLNGAPAKASSTVRAGDVVTLRLASREKVLEVVQVIERRVGAPVAAECLVDRSPPPPVLPAGVAARGSPAARLPGSGRPTKKDRRMTDELRGGRGGPRAH
ncbi:MAG TPA: RNA-binding S4 domain-containing protein [Acidimicrobiales bacterium]|nr:RNA-binding S4 domain-containing protein [Acidimicrobiales bacterium]